LELKILNRPAFHSRQIRFQRLPFLAIPLFEFLALVLELGPCLRASLFQLSDALFHVRLGAELGFYLLKLRLDLGDALRERFGPAVHIGPVGADPRRV
jgi:hypothetical protein